MATTNIMNSTNGVLMLAGVIIAELTGCQLSLTHSSRNTTNKDSLGWRELLEGLREWSMTCSAMYIPNGSFDDVFTAYKNRAQVQVRLTSRELGDTFYEGTAYFASGTLDSPAQEDNVVYDVSWDGTGEIVEGATV